MAKTRILGRSKTLGGSALLAVAAAIATASPASAAEPGTIKLCVDEGADPSFVYLPQLNKMSQIAPSGSCGLRIRETTPGDVTVEVYKLVDDDPDHARYLGETTYNAPKGLDITVHGSNFSTS